MNLKNNGPQAQHIDSVTARFSGFQADDRFHWTCCPRCAIAGYLSAVLLMFDTQ